MMRKVMISAAALATLGATAGFGGAADAQQRGTFNRGPAVVSAPIAQPARVPIVQGGGANWGQQQHGTGWQQHGTPPQGFPQHGMQPGRPPQQHGGRWGQSIGGRWYAGAQAPGGWRSYHRPSRGWILPSYWISPSFYISDFADYGLSPPPYGYGWTRYYDDAVLTDSRGQVWDSVSGVDWDGYGGGYAQGYADDGYGAGYPPPGYAPQGYAPQGYAPQGYAPQGYVQQPGAYYAPPRNDGVGGAIAGAVVGGVAGNLIAGHGNRTAGTLIGAGVGAVAGHAIDKSSHRDYPPQAYGAGYPPPAYGAGYGAPAPGYDQAYAPPPVYAQPGVVYARPQEIVQPYVAPGGVTTYYAGAGTVVVQGPPTVTTTTTTTYIEEDARVTYHRPVRRTYRPVRRKCSCACACS